MHVDLGLSRYISICVDAEEISSWIVGSNLHDRWPEQEREDPLRSAVSEPQGIPHTFRGFLLSTCTLPT